LILLPFSFPEKFDSSDDPLPPKHWQKAELLLWVEWSFIRANVQEKKIATLEISCIVMFRWVADRI
jgi:hypothetical protein